MAAGEYRCERSDLFSKLEDAEWFAEFVKFQYQRIVFDMEPIVPAISEYWTAQAHYRWSKDTARVRSKEYDGRPLDHFKLSGFLCYWLRRCPPLTSLHHNPDLKFASVKLRGEPSKILVQYGNVFAAFDIGLRICRYWEAARTDIKYDADAKRDAAVRQRIARLSISRNSKYVEDICYTLAEKNISPHSLNMLYKSLFLAFRPLAI
jgi:hypothetical protein